MLSALRERGKELGLDTLGGFLSGLFLSGAKSGYNAVEWGRLGQEAFDNGSDREYIGYGLPDGVPNREDSVHRDGSP